MGTRFEVYGPFELPRQKYISGRKKGQFRRTIDRASLTNFWDKVDGRCADLRNAVGCYVFSIGKKIWYVGKTEKLRFELEAVQPHKLKHYKAALSKNRKGRPLIYLVPKRTPGGKLSKPSRNGHKDIGFLELLMIGSALDRNPYLRNKRDTKYLRSLHVPGFMNDTGSGRRTSDATKFSNLF